MPHRHEKSDGRYQQLEYAQNCAMFALSKVLGKSTGKLAEEIVDDKIGGVTRISQLENPTVIKKVLLGFKFTPLIDDWETKRHSAPWSEMTRLIKTSFVDVTRDKPTTCRLFAIWWKNSSKTWSDAPIRPGQSDHAFTIFANGVDIELVKTNYTDFDKSHPAPNEHVTVWAPPVGKRHSVQRRTVLPEGDRRVPYIS